MSAAILPFARCRRSQKPVVTIVPDLADELRGKIERLLTERPGIAANLNQVCDYWLARHEPDVS